LPWGRHFPYPCPMKVGIPERLVMRRTLLLLVSVVVVLLAYINVYYVGYIWDDNFFMLQGIRGFQHFSLVGGTGVYYRPLVGVTLGVDHLLWGWKPWGYHLTNLVFHCLNVLMVFWVVTILLEGEEHRDWIAFSAALFFGLYPLNTESVCWISGRTDLLAFTFFLLGVALHLLYRKDRKGRKGWLLLLAALSFLLSLFSKEVGLALVFLIPFLDFVFLGVSSSERRKVIFSYLSYLVILLLYFYLRKASLHPVEERLAAYASVKVVHGGKGRPLLDALSALGFYVRRALFPFRPNLFIGAIPGGYPMNFLTLAVFALLMALSVAYAFVRGRGKVVALSLGWFLFGLLPVLPLAATGVAKTPVADRYLYLPSFAVALVLSWAMWRGGKAWGKGVTLGLVFTLLVSLSFFGVTFGRCVTWTDKLALWKDTARKSPGFGTPLNQYGVALMERKRIQEALQQFALVLKPATRASPETRAHAADNIGFILMGQRRFEDSIPYFEKAIKLAPWDVIAYHNLGIVYMQMAKRGNNPEYLGKAREYLEKAVQVNPTIIDTHYFLGVVYAHSGDGERALREFKRVINMDPRHPYAPRAREWIVRLSSKKGLAPGGKR